MKLMFTVLVALLYSPLALAAQVNLLCNVRRAGDVQILSTVYEKTAVATPNGPKTIFAITDIFFIRSFVSASLVAGNNGQNLAIGECGLATAILQVPPTKLMITFREFQGYFGSVMANFDQSSGVTFTSLNGEATLPPHCSTDVYQFVAQQQSANQFDVVGDAAVTCASP
jgi:hypothetical protein